MLNDTLASEEPYMPKQLVTDHRDKIISQRLVCRTSENGRQIYGYFSDNIVGIRNSPWTDQPISCRLKSLRVA